MSVSWQVRIPSNLISKREILNIDDNTGAGPVVGQATARIKKEGGKQIQKCCLNSYIFLLQSVGKDLVI